MQQTVSREQTTGDDLGLTLEPLNYKPAMRHDTGSADGDRGRGASLELEKHEWSRRPDQESVEETRTCNLT